MTLREVNVLITRNGVTDDHLKQIGSVDPAVSLTRWSHDHHSPGRAVAIEVVLSDWRLDVDLERLPALRWVQYSNAGFDMYFQCRYCSQLLTWQDVTPAARRSCCSSGGHEPKHALPGPNITITTGGGVAAIPISEYAIGMMLAYSRQLPTLFAAQKTHQWISREALRSSSGELGGRTLGIIGFGEIGRRTALLAKAFGMRVLGTRRRLSSPIIGSQAAPADALYPASGLDHLLSLSDFVFLSVPLTAETEGLIGEEQLRAIKPTAVLINAARGGVVDEKAVVRALREGCLAGAVLDVVPNEPLAPESPLWDVPNLVITPHIAAITDRYNDRLVSLFCDNLRRYLDGKPLLHVLDRSLGY